MSHLENFAIICSAQTHSKQAGWHNILYTVQCHEKCKELYNGETKQLHICNINQRQWWQRSSSLLRIAVSVNRRDNWFKRSLSTSISGKVSEWRTESKNHLLIKFCNKIFACLSTPEPSIMSVCLMCEWMTFHYAVRLTSGMWQYILKDKSPLRPVTYYKTSSSFSAKEW